MSCPWHPWETGSCAVRIVAWLSWVVLRIVGVWEVVGRGRDRASAPVVLVLELRDRVDARGRQRGDGKLDTSALAPTIGEPIEGHGVAHEAIADKDLGEGQFVGRIEAQLDLGAR